MEYKYYSFCIPAGNRIQEYTGIVKLKMWKKRSVLNKPVNYPKLHFTLRVKLFK